MAGEKKITVIHLVWLPYGIGLFKQFVDAYHRKPAGAAHELLLVFNGVEDQVATRAYHDYISAYHIPYTSRYFLNGQDLYCYFKTAASLSTEYMMVLNSFSTVLAANWLLHYMAAFVNENTGIVGATGSNQSYYSSVFQKNLAGWESGKGFTYNFRKYKLFVKTFLHWRWLFKPFPSPHLRTNAFMIKTSLFTQLRHKSLVSKFTAYQFESGRNNMTSQVLQLGLAALVVDKNGKTYAPDQWKQSATFWINNQENLLVADNQTGIYANASPEEREQMTRLAWGTI
jgi:hypothetical protein